MRRRVRIAVEDDGGSRPAKLGESLGERTGEIVPEEQQSSSMGEAGGGSAVEGGGAEEVKPAGCIARDSHGRGRRAASVYARLWGARSAVGGGKILGPICRTAASVSVRTVAAGDRRKVAITSMSGRGAHKGPPQAQKGPPQAQKGPQIKPGCPLALGGGMMLRISSLVGVWIPVAVKDRRMWEKARKVLWPIIFGPGRSSHDLLEEAKHRAAVVIFLIVVLAFFMSLTSKSVWVNIPIAALLLAGMRRLYLEVDFNWKWRPSLMDRGQQSVQGFQSASPAWQPLLTPASASSPSEHSFLHHSPSMPPRSETVGVDGVWRQAINAPAVEAAIDDLMRAVVDEFVTNLWYRSLTPDQDATEELRLLLNTAIGEIVKRVKKVNLISLLARDAVELLGKQIDLFRRTRERIGEQLLETLPSGERDEQIRQAMDAAGDLHVSLTSADAEYKVLRRLMGGVVAIILRPEEAHCGVLRCLARELLACALMRPVMKFASPGYMNEIILLLVPSLEERSERRRRASASTPERSVQGKKLCGAPKQTIVIPVQPSDPAPARTPTPRAAAEAASIPTPVLTPVLTPVQTPVPVPPVLGSSSLDAQSESMSSSASVGSSGKDIRCTSRNKSWPGSGSVVYEGYKGLVELDGRKRAVCYRENGVVEGAELSLPDQGTTAMSKRFVSPLMRDTGEMDQARNNHVNKGHLGGVKVDKEETRCKYVDGQSKALVAEHWDGLWTGVDGKGRRRQGVLVKGEGKENGGVKTTTAASKSGQERKSEAEGRKRPKRDIAQREEEVMTGPERPAACFSTKAQEVAIMAKERPGLDQSTKASVKSDVEKDESTELFSLKGRRQNEGVNVGEEEDGERYFGSLRQQQREDKFRRLFDDDRVEEIRGIGFLGMEDKGLAWRAGQSCQSCQSNLVARSDLSRSSCSGQGRAMGKVARLELTQDAEKFPGSQQQPSTIHEVKGLAPASQHYRSVSPLSGVEMQLSEDDELDAEDLDEVDSLSTLRRHGKGNLHWPMPTAQEKKDEIEEVHLKGNRWEDQPVVGRMNEHQRSSSVNLGVAGDRLTLLRRSASDVGCSSPMFDTTIKLQAKVVDTWLQEAGLKSFVVYSIFVTHVDGSDWIVNRRYRNFEQLHRVLKEMPQYRLKLPPKRFFTHNLDGDFVYERRIQLDKFLQDVLEIPSIAESHAVCDFLSSESKTYGYGGSSSVIKALAVHVDDAVDTVFRRLGEVSDEFQGALSKATTGIRRRFRDPVVGGEQSVGRLAGASHPPHDENGRTVGIAHYSTTGNLLEGQVIIHRSRSLCLDRSNGGKGAIQGRGGGVEGNIEPLTGLQIPGRAELVLEDDNHVTERNEFQMNAEGVGESEAHPPKETGALESAFSHHEAEAEGSMFSSEDEDSIPPEWNVSKLSVPLLNLVDEIFELHQHGWIRRQVFWIARHVLELAMGDAIDDFILTKIQLLRREDVIAAAIKWIHKMLWPDGIFFSDHPDNRPSPYPAIVPNPAYVPLSGRSSPRQLERNGPKVQKPDGEGKGAACKQGKSPQPTFQEKLEAARKAELVKDFFVGRPPTSLSSLIGSKQYKKCALDAYYFLQSPVCIRQYAYGLLEIVLLAVFPELHALIQDVRSGIA